MHLTKLAMMSSSLRDSYEVNVYWGYQAQWRVCNRHVVLWYSSACGLRSHGWLHKAPPHHH